MVNKANTEKGFKKTPEFLLSSNPNLCDGLVPLDLNVCKTRLGLGQKRNFSRDEPPNLVL